MTEGQKGIWFISRLDPEGYAYNIPFAFRLSRGANAEALRRCFQGIQDRHPALRTVFRERDGEPFQQVLPSREVFFEEGDLSHLVWKDLVGHISTVARQPFDLGEGPLLRVFLFSRGHRGAVMLINLHHLVFDGASYDLLVDELLSRYQAEMAGESLALETPAGDLRRFQAWQGELMASAKGEELLDYWQGILADVPLQLDLLPDLPRPESQTFVGEALELAVEPVLTASLRALATSQKTNLFSLLLGAWGIPLGPTRAPEPGSRGHGREGAPRRHLGRVHRLLRQYVARGLRPRRQSLSGGVLESSTDQGFRLAGER